MRAGVRAGVRACGQAGGGGEMGGWVDRAAGGAGGAGVPETLERIRGAPRRRERSTVEQSQTAYIFS